MRRLDALQYWASTALSKSLPQTEFSVFVLVWFEFVWLRKKSSWCSSPGLEPKGNLVCPILPKCWDFKHTLFSSMILFVYIVFECGCVRDPT